MNTAYPLIPVSVLTILAYLATWIFMKWGMFPLKSFRKFWNVLLLATFFVSGLIGLLSVVKINYKLAIPQYDFYLKWHVAVGIGMVIIAFFHLSWHLKYYFARGQKSSAKPVEQPELAVDAEDYKKYRLLLFLLGLATIINQVVFIREFMSVMAGNELVLGIVMANWLLLTAWGAYSGRVFCSTTFNPGKVAAMVFVLPVLMMASIGLLYGMKQLLYPPGTLTGVGVAVAGSLLLLFPVCFLSGYLFTILSARLSEVKNKNLIGSAYMAESVGSLAGGLLFSLFFAVWFNTYQVLAFAALAILFSGVWIQGSGKTWHRPFYTTLALLIPVGVLVFNPGSLLKKGMFPNQKIVLDKSTPYGNLVVTEQAGQLNFYEGNGLQFYTDNFMGNEEAVHFAMVQHPSPENVLLISGGISGMIDEILKYDVKKITYLETNPAMVKQWEKLVNGNDFPQQVEFVNDDIRVFLLKSRSKYDVILMNLPPPSTLGMNRFYTSEFFRLLEKHCTPESVVCASLPSTANYVEENALDVNASLWKTLGCHFTNRRVLQGGKNYFLVSGSPLSIGITSLIEKKGIENEYVNAFYFDDDLLRQRSELLESQFPDSAKINSDFRPNMFISQVFHWLDLFGISYWLLAGIPVLFFILLFFRMNAVTTGLYTGGFTAASLEVSLMFVFQSLFGSLYVATAFFFTVFMAGLVSGSWWGNKVKTNPVLKDFSFLQILIAVITLVVPLVVIIVSKFAHAGTIARGLIYLVAFILSFSIGYEFYLASKLQALSVRNTSGLNYSADLAGSAFGAFLAAIVLLPLLGLAYTCLVVAGLNVFSAGRAFLSKASIES